MSFINSLSLTPQFGTRQSILKKMLFSGDSRSVGDTICFGQQTQSQREASLARLERALVELEVTNDQHLTVLTLVKSFLPEIIESVNVSNAEAVLDAMGLEATAQAKILSAIQAEKVNISDIAEMENGEYVILTQDLDKAPNTKPYGDYHLYMGSVDNIQIVPIASERGFGRFGNTADLIKAEDGREFHFPNFSTRSIDTNRITVRSHEHPIHWAEQLNRPWRNEQLKTDWTMAQKILVHHPDGSLLVEKKAVTQGYQGMGGSSYTKTLEVYPKEVH